MAAITRSPYANESRRYFMSSLFVRAGSGPPVSQSGGGSLCSISLKKPKFAHATCFTCSPNVRTSLNSPFVGLKEYSSPGIASARPTNCRWTMRHHCPTDPAIVVARSWAMTVAGRRNTVTSAVQTLSVRLVDFNSVALDDWIGQQLIGDFRRELPRLSGFARREVELEVLALANILDAPVAE